jgi:hypothetical protein
VEVTGPVIERASSWARRSAELGARIRDLHERNAQLSASSGPPDLEERRAVGSTPNQLAKAKALASMANLRAFEVMRRTVTMRLQAASTHDRAAQLHELLANAGQGDIQAHRDRAVAHRQEARDDRAGAARMLHPRHVKPPESGHS